MWLEEEVDVMLYPMGKSKHIFLKCLVYQRVHFIIFHFCTKYKITGLLE